MKKQLVNYSLAELLAKKPTPLQPRVSIYDQLPRLGGKEDKTIATPVLRDPFLKTFEILLKSRVLPFAATVYDVSSSVIQSELQQLKKQTKNEHHLSLGRVVPIIETLNRRGAILNDRTLPPVEQGYVPLLVLVHRRHTYVRGMIDSLRKIVNIEKTLVIFSCDGFFPEVLQAILEVTFVRVKIIYYPVPISMLGPAYPGFDGTSYKTRDVKVISLKNHWWWAHNYVWGDETWQRPREDPFQALAYIEEDHALTPDFYETMQGLLAMQSQMCQICTFINMGIHMHSHSTANLDSLMQVRAKPIDNIGIVTRREVWLKALGSAQTFCTFDDYNWDWSWKALIKAGNLGHMALVPSLTRIEHFGHHCGLHTDKKQEGDCPVGKTLEWIRPVEQALASLRRTNWKRVSTKLSKPIAQPQGGFGGWSDPRDHQFCMAFLPRSPGR